MKKKFTTDLPAIGWREWLALPELGIANIKAKIDTGARSSALHAYDVKVFQRDGKQLVRFKVHPFQHSRAGAVSAEAELMERREVKTSSGHVTLRPVIVTSVELQGQRWPIELTLASRDTMGFRMLLGRHALAGRFVVDPSRSFLGSETKPRPRRPRGGKS